MEGYKFFKHNNPVKVGVEGYILNKQGNIIANVMLDGRIIYEKRGNLFDEENVRKSEQ